MKGERERSGATNGTDRVSSVVVYSDKWETSINRSAAHTGVLTIAILDPRHHLLLCFLGAARHLTDAPDDGSRSSLQLSRELLNEN